MMKILIVEDDQSILMGLAEIFTKEGYEVIQASNGNDGIKLYESEQPDILCLDIMMPEKDGYEVCEVVRSKNQDIPIIFISAKSEEVDKVLGLELGADDFITKPFGVREVVARIRAVTRRYLVKQAHKSESDKESKFVLADIEIIPNELKAVRENETIELSIREVALLRTLAENQGKVVTRDQLFDAGWGKMYLPSSRTLDQHMSLLRRKIEADPNNASIIKTVHGVGYRYG